MITPESLEQVRAGADIVQIIGEHVNLKRTGSDYRGPCPFHQGTKRNFSVAPKKGIYYCFVCHASGDVIDFVKERLGLDFTDAVKHVAARAGVEVRETERKRDERDPYEPLHEANASAASYFREMLWDEKTGRTARDYLAHRRVTRDVADIFELGFAPEDAGALRDHLNALGFADERLLEAGLLYKKEDSDEIRVRFRNRLMFPIFDAGGHCVGFGGRKLGAGEPKYLNSAESPIFSKGKLLYGLNRAKHTIRREDRVLIVEGYFDTVRLNSVGIESVVAPLGTALTEAQAALLRRFTKNAYLLYDSDDAGLKATFTAGDQLLRHGFAVQVVTLPGGEDPDSFVDKHGRDAIVAQLGSAIDIFERKVQLLQRAGWFADLQKKRKALNRLLPTIRATSDALMREIYLSRAAEAAGVGKELLQREIAEMQPGAGFASANTSHAAAPALPVRTRDRRGGERRRVGERGEAAERTLVSVMIHHRARIEPIGERIGADEFRTAEYREIFARLLASDADASLESIAEGLSAPALQAFQALLEQPDAIVDVQRTVDDSLAALQVRGMQRELEEIDDLLPLATDAEKDELTRRKMRLRRDIGAHGGIGFRHFGKSRP